MKAIVGGSCRIVANTSAHNFEIGETVEIVRYEQEYALRAKGANGKCWWVGEDEIEPIDNTMKVGGWVTNTQTNETFFIAKIGDYHIPQTTEVEEAYYNTNYEPHIIYHCRPATQDEIEVTCTQMLENE